MDITVLIAKETGSIRDTMAIVTFSNSLMVQPRPADLAKTLKKQEDHFKKHGFSIQNLPTYVHDLYLECMDSTVKKTSAAHSDTRDGGSTTASSNAASGSVDGGTPVGSAAAKPPKRRGEGLLARVAKAKQPRNM